MLNALKHLALIVGMFNLLHLNNLLLLQNLDGIEAHVMFRLDEVNTPKATGTKSTVDIEISQSVFALGLAGRLGFGFIILCQMEKMEKNSG